MLSAYCFSAIGAESAANHDRWQGFRAGLRLVAPRLRNRRVTFRVRTGLSQAHGIWLPTDSLPPQPPPTSHRKHPCPTPLTNSATSLRWRAACSPTRACSTPSVSQRAPPDRSRALSVAALALAAAHRACRRARVHARFRAGEGRDREAFAERVIHGWIYKARPDVMAVCHHHAPAVLPFVIAGVPIVPVFHLGAAVGETCRSGISATSSATPICSWSSRRRGVRSRARSGKHPAVLMTHHGATVVGPTCASSSRARSSCAGTPVPAAGAHAGQGLPPRRARRGSPAPQFAAPWWAAPGNTGRCDLRSGVPRGAPARKRADRQGEPRQDGAPDAPKVERKGGHMKRQLAGTLAVALPRSRLLAGAGAGPVQGRHRPDQQLGEPGADARQEPASSRSTISRSRTSAPRAPARPCSR